VLNTHSITWWLMANQASGVRTISDLQGKVVGIEGPGTLSATFTRVLLRKHGLNPDADVQYASLGPVPNWLQGAIGGAVDAAIAGDVDLRLLGEGQGLTEVAWYGQDVKGSLIGLATSESMLRGNADLTRRFLRAVNRALASYRANKDETVALAARLLDQPPEFVARAYDISASLLLDPPMLAPDVQREFLDLAKETLNIDRAVDPGEIFDYGITRQVVQ
jgi:ABC-type nitrate/sulfonate/bicarbonate transport system substrate-binding protein